MNSKKQIADWEGLDDLCLDFETNVKKSIYSGNPFLSLNILQCPDLQKKYAEIYIKNKFNNYPRSNHNNFNYPIGVAINQSGEILVADLGNNRVQIWG